MNSAEASSGDTNFGTDTAEVTASQKTLDKTAKQVDNSNHIKYSITVNPEAADLIEGDVLTLTDVMDADASFVRSSLTVTTVTGEDVEYAASVEAVTDADGNPTEKLTLTVPDKTPVLVTYEVLPNATVGTTIQLTNTVELEGTNVSSATDDQGWVVQKPAAGTEGVVGSFSVSKADSGDATLSLPGAEFTLYEVDMDSLPDGEVTEEALYAAATKVSTATTDASGVATFGTSGSQLKTSTLYFFVETKAPTYTEDGTTVYYELDDTIYYVMLKGNDSTAYENALAEAKTHGITPSAKSVYNVSDKQREASGALELTGTKEMEGRKLAEGESYTFYVYRDYDAATGEGTLAATGTSDATGAITFDRGLTYTLADLGGEGSATFHYVAVEDTSALPEGVSADTGSVEFSVTVTDDGDETLEVDPAFPEGGLKFVNSWEQPKHSDESAQSEQQSEQHDNKIPKTGDDTNGAAAALLAAGGALLVGAGSRLLRRDGRVK